MGARICPRCATRVDERRAKTSPYCLRCGAPLGPPAPIDVGRASTFGGKQPGAGGGSPLPWILGGIGLFVFLGIAGIVGVIAFAASKAEPDSTPVTLGTSTKVEAPPTSTATVSTPPTSTVKTPTPTARPTATVIARPTSTPTPFPSVVPTATGTGSAGALAAFNRSKAQAEVDRVAATLASCKRTTGPFGAGSIRVDFEPDGRVGTLSRAPFSGTPVGSCISARFLAIRIGPFDGSRQSIEKAFIIQE